MQYQLFIYIREPESYLHWQLLDRGQRQAVYEGSWEQLQQYLDTEGVVSPSTTLLLPAECALHCKVELPPSQLKYVHKALPFAIEDKLVKDPDYYHLIPNSRIKNGKLPVIAIDLEYLESIRSQMISLGLEPGEAYLDSELLFEPGKLGLCYAEGRTLISFEDLYMATDDNWAGQVIEHLSEEIDTLGINMVFDEGVENPDILVAQVQNTMEVEVATSAFQGDLLNHLVDKMLLKPKSLTNIFTGRFSFKAESKSQFKFLQPAAIAASVMFVLFLVANVVETRRQSALAEGYAKANEALCKDIFGPEKRCRENLLKKEVENVLNNSAGQSANSGMEFLASADDIAQAMRTGLEIQSLRYNQSKSELLAVITGKDFGILEAFKNAMIAKGYNAELSASQDGGKSRGNFKITKGGA